jgi:ABC-type multidrug transport system permease subunit
MVYKLREPAAVMTQASMAIIMPLLVGGIYWNIPLTQTAVTDRLAAVSFLVLVQSFMCMDQILLFPKERAVYLRDHATGLHSTSSFFLARTLAEMPFILLFAVISAVISYWMCVTRLRDRLSRPGSRLPMLSSRRYGFQRDVRKFFLFVAALAAVTDTGAAFLSSIGAMSETMEMGNLLATLGIVILTLLDGACPHASVPAVCACSPPHQVSTATLRTFRCGAAGCPSSPSSAMACRLWRPTSFAAWSSRARLTRRWQAASPTAMLSCAA